MSESRAIILGCAGTVLSAEERAFFAGADPWGFILFGRNIGDADEIRALCADLRSCVGRADAPIFIDQEGGRVQRIRAPIAPAYPPAAELGAIYRRDRAAGLRAAYLMSRLHAFDLGRLGISADCLPVLDIPGEGTSDVIGNRAYGRDPLMVTELGRAAADGLIAGGIAPVMKHMPGHGRATTDSHHELPIVEASIEELRARDFVPFRAMNDLGMAMTAHLVYTAIDPDRPGTASPRVIGDIIRGEIGFDGLLMSDDLSMKALSGTFEARTEAILAAGCDIVLHCNGVMDEMAAVAGAAPRLAGEALRRARQALRLPVADDGADEHQARAEFSGHWSAVA